VAGSFELGFPKNVGISILVTSEEVICSHGVKYFDIA
jgi:hypothetical protein